MNEEQIRKIVRDEMEKNYRAGSPIVAPHSHNGTDNLNVDPINLIGFNPLPTGTAKYLNPDGTYTYGFASTQQLEPADSSHAEQYIGNVIGTNGNQTGTIASYPIPLVIGNGVGNQGSFNGGYAPDGTMVAFITGSTTTSFLYIRWDGQWFGVQLSATPVTP